MRLGNAHLNQINMPRTKNTYTSAMLQRRVPAELKPELDEIITNYIASFKKRQELEKRTINLMQNLSQNV